MILSYDVTTENYTIEFGKGEIKMIDKDRIFRVLSRATIEDSANGATTNGASTNVYRSQSSASTNAVYGSQSSATTNVYGYNENGYNENDQFSSGRSTARASAQTPYTS